MELSDYPYAQEKLAQLQRDCQVEVIADWGDAEGEWKPGTWTKAELDRLHDQIALMAGFMGGNAKFSQNLCGVTIRKADIGSHGGEALSHRVSLSTKGAFSPWTVIHELAHAWDANFEWKLSRQLEKYTGGYTSHFLSLMRRLAGLSDSGRFSPENK